MSKSSSLKQRIGKIQKLREDEKQEFQELLDNLQDIDQDLARETYELYQKLIAIDREIEKIFEDLNKNNYRNVERNLENLESKMEEIDRELLNNMEKEGLDKSIISKIKDTEARLDKIYNDFESWLKEKIRQQAETSFYDERLTVKVEEKALANFLKRVQRDQVEKNLETLGYFYYQKQEIGVRLVKFHVLENTVKRKAQFNVKDKIREKLEKFGEEGNAILAHSHPIGDYIHSGSDKNFLFNKENLSIIGVRHTGSKKIFFIPQKLEQNRWRYLPLKVAKNGSILDVNELEERWPQITAYNKAAVKVLIEGKEILVGGMLDDADL